jgi:hypothetical protein
MAELRRVATAVGEQIGVGKQVEGAAVKIGRPPVVFQTQSYGYVVLNKPEQLKQWEEDLRNFYGISVDAAGLSGRACETCSCGCTDDCGLLA